MPDTIPADSVGLVETQYRTFDGPLALDCGRELPGFTLAYETYGTLNDARSNALLICHALSSDQHAAGYHSMDDAKPGWWDSCIGPGKPFNTDEFFVVCPNNLGGCQGQHRAEHGQPGDRRTLRLRLSHCHRARLGAKPETAGRRARHRALGGGGRRQPRRNAGHAVGDRLSRPPRARAADCGAPKLSAQNIAFNEVARQAIAPTPTSTAGAITTSRRRRRA